MKALHRSLVAAALAAAVHTLLGCGSEESDPPTPMGPSSSGAVCPSGSTLTYEGFAMGFFADYCTHCHSTQLSGSAARNNAPAGYNWDDYDSIAAHAADIDNVAAAGPRASNDFMPPEGEADPSAAERSRLGEWLACEFAPGMP